MCPYINDPSHFLVEELPLRCEKKVSDSWGADGEASPCATRFSKFLKSEIAVPGW